MGMGLFGKSTQKSPRDQCREWTSKLRKQGYLLDREVRKIENGEFKIKQDLKQAAKKGDKDVCKILARELVRSKKAKSRLHAAKSQINSISMIMNEQIATVQMAGSMQKSTEVMMAMQRLVSVASISSSMQELSREMMKTGIIGEMMDEAIEEAVDDEPIDEEVQAEIEKITAELNINTTNKISETTSVNPIIVPQVADEVDNDDEYIKMQQRLEGLKS